MAEAFSTVVTIIIMVAIASRFRAMAKGQDGRQNRFGRFEQNAQQRPQAPLRTPKSAARRLDNKASAPASPKERKVYGTANAPGIKFSGDSPFFRMEDRSNDWLARQMKEEQRILRRGDLRDLGAAHEASCDADDLKRRHLLEHDDSIDDGEL